MSTRGWLGVDLDGTLAVHGTGDDPPGEPIGTMVIRVQGWLALGFTVKVVTARVSTSLPPDFVARQRALIEAWCERHLGRRLEVTAEKDLDLLELWDDRAVTVERNTGRLLSPSWYDGSGSLPKNFKKPRKRR